MSPERRLATLLFLLLCSACGQPPTRADCSTTCTGCCDAAGVCQSGSSQTTCGVAGRACTTCSTAQTCAVGVCVGGVPSTNSGGGAANVTTGGGAANLTGGGGGSTAGGTANTTPRSQCAGTTLECRGACIDPATDEANCGDCGNQCQAGLVCNAGRCEALPTDCLSNACPGDFGCDPETRTCARRCFSNADCKASGSTCSASGTCGCSGGARACGAVCTGQASSCRCPSGFEGHPTLGCVDVDECARGMTCGANEQCRNESPGASCQCLNGFVRVGGQCVINRCLSGNGGCHASATCSMRTATDVACTCHQGFIGDGQRCAAECLSSGACADPSLTCYPSADSWYGVCERPGFGPAGSLCATNGDCQAGTRCEHAPGGNIGFCAQLCTNTSCSAGETCTQRNDGARVCLANNGATCDLLTQNCVNGCYASQQGAMCGYSGSRVDGASCTYVNDCVLGSTCVGLAMAPTTCHQLCDPASPRCPSGKSCQPLTGFGGAGVCD